MRGLIAIAALAAIALTGLSACGGEEKENLARRIVTHPNSKDPMIEWTVKTLPGGDTAMHGVYKEFYWGGAVKKSVIWKDGQRDGSAQAWYDNGGQMWQKVYDKGKKAKTWRLFYSDGNPWLVLEYKDGGLDGKVQKWDRADPSTPKEATYANGSCVSGDCALLNLPELTEDLTPEKKNEVNRDRALLTDFLD